MWAMTGSPASISSPSPSVTTSVVDLVDLDVAVPGHLGGVPTSPSIVTDAQAEPASGVGTVAAVVVTAGDEAQGQNDEGQGEREDTTGTSGHGDTFGNGDFGQPGHLIGRP